MIFEKPFIKFSSNEERDNFLIKYKLLSKNSKKEKIYLYKGKDVSIPTPCEIIGYEQEYSDSATLVIDYGKGTCFIHSDYLKEMQDKSFKRNYNDEKIYDFVAIDFETANNHMNSACSVGLAAVSNNEIVTSDYFLIKPPTDYFSAINSRINGITYDTVKDNDNFSEIYPTILDYINQSKVVMAHNAQFDMSVLYNCIKYYNLPLPEFIYIDTINFSAQVKSDGGNSLEDCANYFNIELSDHHNALCDAEVCAKIVIESIKNSKAENLIEYLHVFPSVKQKMFSNLTPYSNLPKHQNTKKKNNTIKISEISATVTDFDQSNALYQKNCVFTGEFETFSRREGMQMLVNVGGIVKSTVSSKTDYLIVGTQDKDLVGEDGLSSKEEKAYSLIENGINIKIIHEKEFLEMLHAKNSSVEQLSFSFPEPENDNFYERLQKLLDNLIEEYELPSHSLHLFSNVSQKGKNKGQEISKSICIYEPEFPIVKEDVDNPGKNLVVLNIQQGNDLVLLIRQTQFDAIPVPDTAQIKELKSDTVFKHIIFKNTDNNIFDYIKDNIRYCLKNYRTKERGFACCSRFVECSDAKRCLHENKLYSTACSYRHNLEAGKIFYGKNKNI